MTERSNAASALTHCIVQSEWDPDLLILPASAALEAAESELKGVPCALSVICRSYLPIYAVSNDFYRQALELDLRGKREYTETILSAMGGIEKAHFSRIKALLRLSDEALEPLIATASKRTVCATSSRLRRSTTLKLCARLSISTSAASRSRKFAQVTISTETTMICSTSCLRRRSSWQKSRKASA